MHAMRERFPDYASQVFSDQVADRAAGTGSWSPDDPSKYLTGLLTLSLPWVGLLGCVATPLMKRFADRRRPLTYLLLWCAGLVALFASAAGKREHYILPMIPALCLLMGFVAEDVFFRHRWISPRLARTLSLGYGLAAPVGVATVAVLWALGVGQLQWGPLMVVAVLAGVPVAAAGAQGLRGRLPHVPVLLVAGFGLLMVGYWQVYPMHDDRRGIEEFAREVARLVPEDEPLHHFGDPQAKTVFYAGRQIPGLNWPIWHEMWRRSGEPPRPAAVQAELARRLEGQPAFAPWIVGYQAALGKRRPEADRLAELGYEVVHEYHGIQERRYVFTLWHRPVEAATTRNTAAR
jgi:4-amino-4-deoxy-L-arabinose transferase-like glycosyltransferase